MIDFRSIPFGFVSQSVEEIDKEFRDLFRTSSRPFRFLTCKNLSRKIKIFRPHSIRSLVAIHLTWLGMSDDRVMAVVGWRDARSLELYRVVPRDDCLTGANLDWIIEKANRLRL